MIKVSVIVPVYNVEAYLPKCLDSLINQTLKEIEIIVVNDGSPDNSQKIIDKYSKKHDTIKGFIKENGGLSDARNFGLSKAKGEYVAFIDSDDYIAPNMLEVMYNKAAKETLDIVVCDTINVYEQQDKEEYIVSNHKYSQDNITNYLLSPPMACIRIYKKKLFNNIKFTKNIYYEDLDIVFKLLNYTTKIGFVEEGLYYYLQRQGSIMKQTAWNEKLLDIFKVLEGNYNVLYKQYPDEVEYMYITHLLRTATLRILDYQDVSEQLNLIRKEIKDKFPNWHKNKFYKQSSFKLRLICQLAYNKQYSILKLIKKITHK